MFAIALPALLVSRLSPSTLAAWTIVLQSATYTIPFTLGIQSVIASRIAGMRRGAATRTGTDLLHTAMQLMLGAAALYFLVFVCVALFFQSIYRHIPPELMSDARWAVFVFAIGQSSVIPMAVVSGYFMGIQRNAPIAIHAVASRLAMAGGVIYVSDLQNLSVMSAVAATLLLVSNALLFFYFRLKRQHRESAEPIAEHHALSVRTLWQECAHLSIWALATFAIYGGTSTISSILDWSSFAEYSISVGISLLFLGLHTAAFSTLIPYIAHASLDPSAARAAGSIHRAAFVSATISVLGLLGTLILGNTMLQFFLPTIPSAKLIDLVVPLLVGNSLRLVGLPYANALIGLGIQARLTSTAIMEASVTLICAVIFGWFFGTQGVAWSIAAGGIVSIGMHYCVNSRATYTLLPISRTRTFMLPFLVIGITATLTSGVLII